MTEIKRVATVLMAVMMVGLWSASAAAQVFGTFSWQMQPYCNIVTLTITQIPGGFTVGGNDNQCGAGKLAGAAGMALINPDGTVGLEFTIVTAPAGKALHVSASLSPATGSGPWTDSVGNTGTLALGANAAGLARPYPASGLAAATVTATELAPAAVGPAHIAPNAVTGAAVADGSLTMADIANGPRLASGGNSFVTPLTTADAVYASVTLTAPGPGTVLVNASGYLRFDDLATTETPRCSITNGTTLDGNYLIIDSDSSSTPQLRSWAGTRTIDVGSAGSFTANLVCSLFLATNTSLGRPRITALFVAR